MPDLCGKPTKRGTCRFPLRNGKCLVHDCADLAARNAAVAAAFRKRDPQAFRAQRQAAGKRGYAATGGTKGWEVANEKAREYRLAHPGNPEQWAMDVLASARLNHFEREYPVLDGSAVDIAWPEQRMAIEINGHQSKAAFGESCARADKHAAKVAALEAQGWRVLVVDVTGGFTESAAHQLIQFAQEAQESPCQK